MAGVAPTMVREKDAGPVLDFVHGDDAGELDVLPAAMMRETGGLSASHVGEDAVGMAREMAAEDLVLATEHDVRGRGVAAAVVNELAQEGAVGAAIAAAEEGTGAVSVGHMGASLRRDERALVVPGEMRRRKPCIGHEQGPQGNP